MILEHKLPALEPLRLAIANATTADEAASLTRLLSIAEIDARARIRVAERARQLVLSVREQRKTLGGLDAFMHEYDLSSDEGVILMCLAEALLRIPDAHTANRLIRDKLSKGNWDQHLGSSNSVFVNASTWSLMLTGRVVQSKLATGDEISSFLAKLQSRVGEPVIRLALYQAMRILGRQFVMGGTIKDALVRSQSQEHQSYRHSFDMLGEAALSDEDARRYCGSYSEAIAALSDSVTRSRADPFTAPGISVKLSALHPRFEFAQRERVLAELTPRLHDLGTQAYDAGITLTIDMEESDRFDLTLDVFEATFNRLPPDCNGFGLALQAYQKRAIHVVEWLTDIARKQQRRIPVRLVKGAYWDTEIKLAQQRGLDTYPVFTRKSSTDVSYLACAQRVWAARDALFPQFATHNAHTVAYILEMAGNERDFEFQRLHGMGDELYRQIVGQGKSDVHCRVYAPVGSHEDLLPYLVRRLLENGANTSFVNRISDDRLPVEEVTADPVDIARHTRPIPNPRIPRPVDLYQSDRRNARGIDLTDALALKSLAEHMAHKSSGQWSARPLIDGDAGTGQTKAITNPSDQRQVIGHATEADDNVVDRAVTAALNASDSWRRTDLATRAKCLERTADLLEKHRAELMSLCILEGGKTIADSLAEVREATDFCLYYAACARRSLDSVDLVGPTGENNVLGLHGRGVFVCISPWNFPLAIFCGQVCAALVAGNTVIAKPAEQTPLVAERMVRLLHEAGIPLEALQFLPGNGERVGSRLVSDHRIAGVAFTGSTETARTINRTLAARKGPIVPFIAETGGQNAMIVDSSALPEQVVRDVLDSAFSSAGQRCSALRVLFVQQEVSARIVRLLTGAMEELTVGDPALLSTDIGPVIDQAARAALESHSSRMNSEAKLVCETALPPGTEHGTFFAPRVFELDSLDRLKHEVFGPILHIIEFSSQNLHTVIESVNATGYGLTLGIHSRIDQTIRYVRERARVGNLYVNRNMIGATVGVQPFGGEGLSGTGPKAGGPNYLQRFATERTVTINTAAVGGNASLFSETGSGD